MYAFCAGIRLFRWGIICGVWLGILSPLLGADLALEMEKVPLPSGPISPVAMNDNGVVVGTRFTDHPNINVLGWTLRSEQRGAPFVYTEVLPRFSTQASQKASLYFTSLNQNNQASILSLNTPNRTNATSLGQEISVWSDGVVTPWLNMQEAETLDPDHPNLGGSDGFLGSSIPASSNSVKVFSIDRTLIFNSGIISFDATICFRTNFSGAYRVPGGGVFLCDAGCTAPAGYIPIYQCGTAGLVESYQLNAPGIFSGLSEKTPAGFPKGMQMMGSFQNRKQLYKAFDGTTNFNYEIRRSDNGFQPTSYTPPSAQQLLLNPSTPKETLQTFPENPLGQVLGFESQFAGIMTRLTLYNPRSQPRLPAGSYLIADVRSNATAQITGVRFNDRGQVLFALGGNGPSSGIYSWLNGSLQRVNPTNSTPGEPQLIDVTLLNNRGEMLGRTLTAKTLPGGGSSNVVDWVILRPGLDLVITANSNRVTPGQSFTVRAQVTNPLQETVTNIRVQSPPHWEGSGHAELIVTPGSTTAASLAPGESAVFYWTFRATEIGTGSVVTSFVGNKSTRTVSSSEAATDPVQISIPGDLTVRSGEEPLNARRGRNQFQETPLNDQNVSLAVGDQGNARYRVRLENLDAISRRFFLRGVTNVTQPWRLTALRGGTDITAALLSPGRYNAGAIPAGGAVEIVVEFSPGSLVGNRERKSLLIEAFDSEHPEVITDALRLTAVLADVPVDLTMYSVNERGLTQASINAGLADLDAPLVPESSPVFLNGLPQIHGGLVADGVTPLLIHAKADPNSLRRYPEGREFDLTSLLYKGGNLRGADLNSRIRFLKQGRWVGTRRFTLKANESEAWFQLLPIPSDDVNQEIGSYGLSYQLGVVEAAAQGDILDSSTPLHLGVRRPPVFFIHGYNTDGHWGADSMFHFSTRYEPGVFLQEVRYGQDSAGIRNPLSRLAGTDLVNVYTPLRDLVPKAEKALEEALAYVQEDWAVTRYDVVCHSQGGLLVRMLGSEHEPYSQQRSFRNRHNHYRGRYHRAVTIGSPHNGTRLLRYILSLYRSDPLILPAIPTSVGLLAVVSGTAQDKFDPFGPQIRELNAPGGNGIWTPDAGARFHLVRTTIGGGFPPSASHSVIGERFLGLAHNEQPVVPLGSDGVVDYLSMATQNAGSAPPANSFTVSLREWISHSGPRDAFESSDEQINSLTVAQHVLSALHQDETLPASVRNFGPFHVPQLLPNSDRDEIDAWANRAHRVILESVFNGIAPSAPDGALSYRVSLTLPPGEVMRDTPGWWAEAHGPDGVTMNGISITPVPNSSTDAIVTVDPAVLGDVVVRAGGRNTRNETVMAQPLRVYRKPASTEAVSALHVGFGDQTTLPVGAVVPIQVGVTYANGVSSLIFPNDDELTATSDQPAVVEVLGPTLWIARGPGTALITVRMGGLITRAEIQVYAPIPQTLSTQLAMRLAENGGLLARWPADPPSELQFADSLNNPLWKPVTEPIALGRTWREVLLSTHAQQQFFRLVPIDRPTDPINKPDMETVRYETGVTEARAAFGATGAGTLIAILDRGIDWKNDDFRNTDGSTRIRYIYDMLDSTGATAPENVYKVGTIYPQSHINDALKGLRNLPTRDAVGHGVTTAGIAAGGGRGDARFTGIAPEAELIIVKLVSDGAPAHDGQPAEAAFYDPQLIPVALNFVRDKAAELKKPCVILLNIGSVGGPTDGTSSMARKIDSIVGPGIPGMAFVSGTSDDGGATNRASGVVAPNQTVSLVVQKGTASGLILDLWYAGSDSLNATIRTPVGSFGPYPAPAAGGFDLKQVAPFTYYQLAPGRVFYEATNGKRELWMNIAGPAGRYTIELTGTQVSSGRFDATLNPSRFTIQEGGGNHFLTYGTPGSIWDAACALNAIVPNSYVIATQYKDIDGFTRTITGQGLPGELWLGSGTGPTFDGRLGLDVSAPGDSVFTTYGAQSYWATLRHNRVAAQNGTYGRASAVSAANPIVTGVIALMLQINPNLDATEIKSILQRSARSDAFTGSTPNIRWGYGKLDAFEALRLTPAPNP